MARNLIVDIVQVEFHILVPWKSKLLEMFET